MFWAGWAFGMVEILYDSPPGLTARDSVDEVDSSLPSRLEPKTCLIIYSYAVCYAEKLGYSAIDGIATID